VDAHQLLPAVPEGAAAVRRRGGAGALRRPRGGQQGGHGRAQLLTQQRFDPTTPDAWERYSDAVIDGLVRLGLNAAVLVVPIGLLDV
jgi:hypothetical protein